MQRYARLLLDYMFKKCFGTEANKPLLISLLNDFLGHRLASPIIDVSYLATVTVGKTTQTRGTVFDLNCQDQEGNRYLVEIQLEAQKYFADRALFYRSRAQSEMHKRGRKATRADPYRLKTLHLLAFLDFELDNRPGYIREIMLMDTRDHTLFTDRECLTYVEVPKLQKKLEDCSDRREIWTWLFQNLHKLNDRPRELREALFDTLFTMAEIAKFKGEELEQYRLSMEFYDDTEACIEYAKEQATKLGWEQGMQQGMQQGEQRGQENAREEIARNLKTLGLPAATIAQSTGLSPDRIAEL